MLKVCHLIHARRWNNFVRQPHRLRLKMGPFHIRIVKHARVIGTRPHCDETYLPTLMLTNPYRICTVLSSAEQDGDSKRHPELLHVKAILIFELFVVQLLEPLQCAGVFWTLIISKAGDSSESQSESRLVARALLNLVVGNLRHDSRLDVDRVATISRLNLLQSFRDRFKLYICQTFECLPDSQELPRFFVPNCYMVVAQPSHPPTTTPVGRDDHHVELVGRFDLEPFLSPRTDRVVARQGFRHEPLVSLVQRGLHETFDLLDVRGYDPWSEAVFWRNLGEYFPTVGVGLIDQGLPVNLQGVEEV